MQAMTDLELEHWQDFAVESYAEIHALLLRISAEDQPLRLFDNGCDDLRVLVPDVDVDELRGEVEVAPSVVVPEVAALRPGHGDGVDRALHRPRVEDVLLRVLDDLRSESPSSLDYTLERLNRGEPLTEMPSSDGHRPQG